MKKILIIAPLDKSANQQRAQSNCQILEQNNFKVKILNDVPPFSHLLAPSLFFQSPTNFLSYFFKNILFKLKFSPYPLWAEMQLRGDILKKYIFKTKPNAVICQNPQDLLCLSKLNSSIVTIYDSPTIFSEELKNENRCSSTDIKKIRDLEKNIFKTAGLVSFHWYSFFELAKKCGFVIANPVVANWSCPSTSKSTHFQSNNRIIYLGKLNSNWVNPSLLETIQSQSPLPVDIFGYESPNNLYHHLQYSGFLPNTDHLSQYQFGLLTFSQTNLRNQGFSAKHLLYLSYGLPVLCPEWRQDKLLAPSVIYYNPKNFISQIKKYSQKENWQIKHQAALKLKKQLTPEKNMADFIDKLKQKINEAQ